MKKWIDGMNPILRWIIFIPTFFVVFLAISILSNIGISRYFGPQGSSLTADIVYGIQTYISLSTSIYCSCYVAPKGKIIIASIWVGIALIITGINIALFLTGAFNHDILSVSISTVIYVAGTITALISVIIENNTNKNSVINS